MIAKEGVIHGKWFVMVKEEQVEPTQMHIILNWFEELKRPVSTH